MAILITGGAGYIGSHTLAHFLQQGETVVVVDNLKTGHREALSAAPRLTGEKTNPPVTFYPVDLQDKIRLEKVFTHHPIEGVIHFAASSLVGESMEHPAAYYRNNVYGTLCLLETMVKFDVRQIVFSSTAAVYGEPEKVPLKETAPAHPENTYGETKLAMERMMHWFDKAHGLRHVSLRYFNAAGAHPSGLLGEDHHPETHLIPLVLQVPLGNRKEIYVFGNDYPTEDGTCIRDYIHVMDLANAHHLALNYLRKFNPSATFNLGSGKGASVLEIIETARKVTGHPIPAMIQPRRPGDPAVLVASSQKANTLLGWEPQYDHLETIMAHAWHWHRKRHGNGSPASFGPKKGHLPL